jgi:hypothetical protein
MGKVRFSSSHFTRLTPESTTTRYGPEHVFNPAEEFTRLAFDTVSLCTMGYRVNSFYNVGISNFFLFVSKGNS